MDRLRVAAASLNPNIDSVTSSPFPNWTPPIPFGMDPNAFMFAAAGYRQFDPRAGRFIQDEPKPQHSYIGLIAMAILSHPERKLVLSDIYQWILDNYPYFRSRGPGWRNSIRHNLSLNDCFVKSGRSANGKGHYWSIHSANVEDFKKGDFRRRRAQRKARKAMGYQVGDEDDEEDSPCEPMGPHAAFPDQFSGIPDFRVHPGNLILSSPLRSGILAPPGPFVTLGTPGSIENQGSLKGELVSPKKRQFDVESLLAPEPRVPGPEMRPEGDISNFLLNLASAQYGLLHGQGIPGTIPWPGFSFHTHQAPGQGSLPPQVSDTLKDSEDRSPTSPSHSDELNNCDSSKDSVGRQTVVPGGSPGSPRSSVQQWQETFAKIMARSYQNRQNMVRETQPQSGEQK